MTGAELILAMMHTPQSPIHHPEGDVLNHSILAAKIMQEIAQPLPKDEQRMLWFAAFFHDAGKITTTNPDTLTAHGHAEAGVEIVRPILDGIPDLTGLQKEQILHLIAEHMNAFNIPHTHRVVERLKRRLFPATLGQLVLLNTADASGRNMGFQEPTRWLLGF